MHPRKRLYRTTHDSCCHIWYHWAFFSNIVGVGKMPLQNCFLETDNATIPYGKTERGPSIKYVSTFFAIFDTPSHKSALFYTYPSSLFPQFLTPPPLSSDVLYGRPQGARQIGKLMLICLILGRSKVVISSVEKNVGFKSTFRLDNLICWK